MLSLQALRGGDRNLPQCDNSAKYHQSMFQSMLPSMFRRSVIRRPHHIPNTIQAMLPMARTDVASWVRCCRSEDERSRLWAQATPTTA